MRAARTAAQGSAQPSGANNFGEIDFLQIQPRRHAIHAREGGHCLYCLRRLITQRRCLDHVVPRASLGSNSYRNLVSCCLDCNSLKADRDAVEFVRSLYRDRRLSAHELTGRLRALDDLAAGKLIPQLPSSARTEMKVRSDPSGPQGEKPVG